MSTGPANVTPSSGRLAPVDIPRLKESLIRLNDIYREIALKADDVTQTRCPYKDAQSRCTADFGCGNQYFTKVRGERAVCSGSDKLDYRRAWRV